ncbi:MAG: hypothetical protein LJE93_14010 [Acidobacteria bacterium]|jgi:hypothetical protein|nr:hypothetical protein [Acidobacteriota bacterium]
MNPRFHLDETTPEAPDLVAPSGDSPPPIARQLFEADWQNSSASPLLLYVAEEPRVGLEFRYFGLDWRIVDYRNGWIARMLVG